MPNELIGVKLELIDHITTMIDRHTCQTFTTHLQQDKVAGARWCLIAGLGNAQFVKPGALTGGGDISDAISPALAP